MGEIRLNHCCRLCLKEGFSLRNIFSQRSAAGDPLYQILNFIYEMKIFENDGLPSQICSPCMWRMIEFDACKKNVRSAEAESVRLLSQMRPDEPSEVEVAIEQKPVNSEVSIKEEIDIVEWEIPAERLIKVPEVAKHFQEDDEDDNIDIESEDVEPFQLLEEEYEEKCNEQVFSQPLQESSQLPEVPNSDFDDTAARICLGESSSVNTAPENNERIRHTNKGTSEKDLGDEVGQAQEALSAEEPKSVLNVSVTDPSFLEAPLSKMKNRFICDICKKGYHEKCYLGRHIRVHYDDRLFSCGVCEKRFKQDTVRYHHELRHLKDTMSDEKSEKRSMKKPLSCGICGRNFGSKSGLINHLNQHSKKYSCSKCGRSFGSSTELKKHSRVHTKEKPFECQNCFKSFSFNSYLTQHMVTHFLDKPFACDVCKKKFKRKQSKKLHELVHLKKK